MFYLAALLFFVTALYFDHKTYDEMDRLNLRNQNTAKACMGMALLSFALAIIISIVKVIL